MAVHISWPYILSLESPLLRILFTLTNPNNNHICCPTITHFTCHSYLEMKVIPIPAKQVIFITTQAMTNGRYEIICGLINTHVCAMKNEMLMINSYFLNSKYCSFLAFSYGSIPGSRSGLDKSIGLRMTFDGSLDDSLYVLRVTSISL